MATAIEVQNLQRHFGSIRAVDGISFTVEEGEVLGFLGPNGAGKTTTVRLLNGVLTPTAGTVRVLGLDPEAAHQVTQLIERLSHRGGRTVFLRTHNLDEAQRLCDRVAVLNQGRLLAAGTLEELSRTLWKGLWVDFALEQDLGPAVLDEVRMLPGVKQVETGAGTLAVQVEAQGMVPDLVATFVGRGARIVRVNPRRHSLEDIYFEIQNQPQGGNNGRA